MMDNKNNDMVHGVVTVERATSGGFMAVTSVGDNLLHRDDANAALSDGQTVMNWLLTVTLMDMFHLGCQPLS